MGADATTSILKSLGILMANPPAATAPGTNFWAGINFDPSTGAPVSVQSPSGVITAWATGGGGGNTRTFRGVTANQASMIALSSSVIGDWCKRTDLNNEIFELTALPASTVANWVPYDPLSGLLTGFALGANTNIVAADTPLGAFGKIQAQINALLSGFYATVIGTVSAGANSVIATGDTLQAMLQKLQAQITALSAGGISPAYQTVTPNVDHATQVIIDRNVGFNVKLDCVGMTNNTQPVRVPANMSDGQELELNLLANVSGFSGLWDLWNAGAPATLGWYVLNGVGGTTGASPTIPTVAGTVTTYPCKRDGAKIIVYPGITRNVL